MKKIVRKDEDFLSEPEARYIIAARRAAHIIQKADGGLPFRISSRRRRASACGISPSRILLFMALTCQLGRKKYCNSIFPML